MIEGLWWIPLAAGLTDAFNPTAFVIAAAFIFLYIVRSGKVLALGIIFSLILITVLVLYHSGLGMAFLEAQGLVWGVKVFNALIGMLCLKFSWNFLKWWQRDSNANLRVTHGIPSIVMNMFRIKVLNAVCVIISAIVLSVIAVQWPIDYNLSMLSNTVMISGGLIDILILVAIYSISLLWPLWLTMLVLASKTSDRFKVVIASGIFLCASTSLLLVFK